MKNKIAWLLAASLLMIVCTVSLSSASANVTVGGWNFTTNLTGWRAADKLYTDEFNNSEGEYVPSPHAGTWRGTFYEIEDLYFPAYPNSPKDNKYYEYSSACVRNLAIVKLPADLMKEMQERDIAIYGPLNKIPEARRIQDLYDILAVAVGDGNEPDTISHSLERVPDDHVKMTTLSGHMACIADLRSLKDYFATAVVSVLLDNDTVGIFWVSNISMQWRFGSKDEVPFNGTAEDIINSLTISKGNRMSSVPLEKYWLQKFREDERNCTLRGLCS